MDHVKSIAEAAEKIKKHFTDRSIEPGRRDAGFDEKYKVFSAQSGVVFSDDIQNMYREISGTKIGWFSEINGENLYGCFEMIPLEDIVPMHDNMTEMLENLSSQAQRTSLRQSFVAACVKNP